MSNQENTIMVIYRVIGGRRIPYHLELDPTMTVVADRPDFDAIRAESRAAAGLPMETAKAAANVAASAAANAHAELVSSLRKSQAAGNTVVSNAPEIVAAQEQTGIVAEEILPGGGKKVTYRPTATDIKVGEWVTPMVKENPLEGTDELRAEYFAAEEAIKAKHAADGTVCKPCEIGALIRKYRAKLEALGHLK